uniref:Uncharacterized protein n=1 Tax=Solanum lycopersicum TaxID=4081 RepID=A0A3Q7HCF2_SOLLC
MAPLDPEGDWEQRGARAVPTGSRAKASLKNAVKATMSRKGLLGSIEQHLHLLA